MWVAFDEKKIDVLAEDKPLEKAKRDQNDKSDHAELKKFPQGIKNIGSKEHRKGRATTGLRSAGSGRATRMVQVQDENSGSETEAVSWTSVECPLPDGSKEKCPLPDVSEKEQPQDNGPQYSPTSPEECPDGPNEPPPEEPPPGGPTPIGITDQAGPTRESDESYDEPPSPSPGAMVRGMNPTWPAFAEDGTKLGHILRNFDANSRDARCTDTRHQHSLSCAIDRTLLENRAKQRKHTRRPLAFLFATGRILHASMHSYQCRHACICCFATCTLLRAGF